MQLTIFTALISTALVIAPALAQAPIPTILNYDTLFDQPDTPFSATSCSADVGVLKGLKTFKDVPNYPHITGSFLAQGFNSPNCGACYELSYKRADGTTVVLPFTVVNSAPKGFTSSLQGAKDLTGLNRDEFTGDVPITYRKVASSVCGF